MTPESHPTSPVHALQQHTRQPTSFSAPGLLGELVPWSHIPLTYTGCFAHLFTQALGRDQEIQEEVQSIAPEVRIQETEHLTQDGGCCGLKRGVEARQGMLDGGIQGRGVLWGTGGEDEK